MRRKFRILDGVRDLHLAGIVGVRGIQAGRCPRALEERAEEENGIGDLHLAALVGVAPLEEGDRGVGEGRQEPEQGRRREAA